VLIRVRAVVDDDSGKHGDMTTSRIVEEYVAQWRGERVDRRHGETVERYAMRGSHQHDSFDLAPARLDGAIGARSDRA
jgi:hypothetical protein